MPILWSAEYLESSVPRDNCSVQCGTYSVVFNSGGPNPSGANFTGDTIAIFDSLTNQSNIVSFTRPLGMPWVQQADIRGACSDGTYAYGLAGSHTSGAADRPFIVRVNPATQVVDTFPFPSQLRGVVNPRGDIAHNKIWIMSSGASSRLLSFDLSAPAWDPVATSVANATRATVGAGNGKVYFPRFGGVAGAGFIDIVDGASGLSSTVPYAPSGSNDTWQNTSPAPLLNDMLYFNAYDNFGMLVVNTLSDTPLKVGLNGWRPGIALSLGADDLLYSPSVSTGILNGWDPFNLTAIPSVHSLPTVRVRQNCLTLPDGRLAIPSGQPSPHAGDPADAGSWTVAFIGLPPPRRRASRSSGTATVRGGRG